MINDLEAYLRNHYDHPPTSLHVAHFNYDLFKEEIDKENIKLDLKPLPYQVSRKISQPKHKILPDTKPETKAEKPKKEKSPEEKPEEEKKEDKKIEVAEEKAKKEESEKFVPTIEIDFEEPEPIKKHGQPPGEKPQTQPESDSDERKKPNDLPFIEYHDKEFDRDRKKKKFIFFFVILVAFIVVAAGTYFLSMKPSSQPVEPVDKKESSPSLNTISQPADDNPQLIEEPYEVNIPGNKSDSETNGKVLDENRNEDDSAMNREGNAIQKTPLKEKPVENAPASIQKSTDKSNQPPQAKEETVKEIRTKPQINKTQEVKKVPEKSAEDTSRSRKAESLESTEKEEKTEQKPLKEPDKDTEPSQVKIASEGDVVAASMLDVKPVDVSTPLPRVSRKTRRSLSGDQNLLVSILIDHNGNIERVKLLRKSNSAEINALIISSIARWKYQPARKDQVRVKTWKQIPITIKQDKE